MSKESIKFLEKNGIDPNFVRSKVDCQIYSREDVNKIVSDYEFQTSRTLRMVSIADIVGYDTDWRDVVPDVFLSIDDLFSSTASTYESRSLSMLNYNKDNVMDGLRKTLENSDEEMVLVETGEGSFAVFTNGLHRYTVLRAFYLAEAAKVKEDDEELKKLAEKYTIPAQVVGIDMEKTYSKYLIITMEAFGADFKIRDIRTHYDDSFTRTGNTEFVYIDGAKDILTDEELRKFLIGEILKFGPEHLFGLISSDYEKYESLKKFINDLNKDLEKTKEGGYPEHD